MMNRHEDYPYVERRKHVCLTEEQMNVLVESVSDEVCKRVQASLKDMVFRELGKSIAEEAPGIIGNIVSKFFWLIGVVGTGIFVYLSTHGFLTDK